MWPEDTMISTIGKMEMEICTVNDTTLLLMRERLISFLLSGSIGQSLTGCSDYSISFLFGNGAKRTVCGSG